MCEEGQRGRRGHCTGAISVIRLLVVRRHVNIATGASVVHVGGRKEGVWGGERPFSSPPPTTPEPSACLAWRDIWHVLRPGPTIAVKYKMALCDSFAAIRGRSRFLTG